MFLLFYGGLLDFSRIGKFRMHLCTLYNQVHNDVYSINTDCTYIRTVLGAVWYIYIEGGITSKRKYKLYNETSRIFYYNIPTVRASRR